MPSGRRRRRDGRAQTPPQHTSPPPPPPSPPPSRPHLTSPPPPPPPSRPQLTSPAFHDIADLPSSSAPALNDIADLPSSSAPAMHDTALLPIAHLQATSAAASTAEKIRPVAEESERSAAVALHKALPPPPHASPPTGFKVPDLLSLKLDINHLANSFDNDGIFHTYPDRGGPFESIQEVQEAIDSHHAVQRKNICMDGLTDEERAIRYALYWYHDGTRKHSEEALVSCSADLSTKELVKALLDKYNEDNGLVGDLAYELEDIVRYNSCFDGKDGIYRSYDHINLTMKTKGAANNDLYFAEVTCMDGYEVYVLTCICMVKPDDNGECHVCGADIKHPAHDGYNRGRPQMSYGHRRRRARGVPAFEELFAVRDEAWLKEEEDRVRRVIMEGKEDRRRSEVEQGKRGNYVILARRRLAMS